MNLGTVLIVQTDAHELELLKQHFEQAGFRVLASGDVAQAWALARKELPQAIVLDLDAAGLDAAALTKGIRATPRTRHIHITLLAMQSGKEDKLTALSAGADEFMIKPVDVEELSLRIRNALRRASFDNLVNPITGLPGPRLIEEQLRGLLRRENWAILRLSLHGFGVFGDIYGFLASEEVLRFTAHLCSQVIDSLGTADDFLGHSGSDNFILVTAPDRARTLSAELSAHFQDGVKAHYSFRERERGYLIIRTTNGHEEHVPLMTLDVHTLTSAEGPFSDIRELTQALG